MVRKFPVHGPVSYNGKKFRPDRKESVISIDADDEASVDELLALGIIKLDEEISDETPDETSVDETPEESVTPEPTDREIIIAAIGELDKNDKAHWTKSNKPDAKVLSENVGFEVSAKLRDEVWAEVQKQTPAE